jgi:protein-S-isoprenylcysteine O-methyltransferase Ste14
MDTGTVLLIAYFISLLIFGVAEIILQIRFAIWKTRGRDRTYLLIMLPFYLSVYLAPAENLLFRYPFHTVLIVTGFLVLAAGVLLRVVAFITLGSNFSVAVKFSDRSRLVVSGIYRYIRHPLYLALILISSSGCFVFSCRYAWILFLLCLGGIILRIRKEETLLGKQYPEYAEYAGKTRKLIPFIY